MIPISLIPGLLKRYNQYFDNYIALGRPSWMGIRRIYYLIDVFLAFIIHGSTLNDYMGYEFYKKRHSEMATFVTVRRLRKVYKINEVSDRIVFDDKWEMHQKFEDFLGRDWIYPRDGTLAEFICFCNNHTSFLVKPRFGTGGDGVYIRAVSASEQMDELYQHFREKDVILDEVITQHLELKNIHPCSVNTIRLSTFYTGKKLNIANAALRMGNHGSIVDNRSAGGLFAKVDVNTGVVITAAFDSELNCYICHPVSRKQIIGFQIPFWEEIIELVTNAFDYYPKCRYVGWDIAVTPKGPVLVEANGRPVIFMHQQADQLGKWLYYKKAIKA